jgi:hypothetical protein
MGTGSFLGVKQLGRGVDHPPPSSAEVKARVELYLHHPPPPPQAFVACYRVNFTFKLLVRIEIPILQNCIFHAALQTWVKINR